MMTLLLQDEQKYICKFYRSLLDITGEEEAVSNEETEQLRAASFCCFTEMPERWAEVSDTQSGVAAADTEFMER